MCYHPMLGIKYLDRINFETGKNVVKVLPRTEVVKWEGQVFSRNDFDRVERVEIPCGKCIDCRLNYSKQWAYRCMDEASQWSKNYFVTLTYAPENLPLRDYVDRETGEILTTSTLVPDHVSQFMKKLRRSMDYHLGVDSGVRFFCAGEYGEQYSRPHYHAILFNCPLPDVKPWFKKDGFQHYHSDFLQDVWGNGICSVEDVTYQSAAYVARYVVKKQKGPNAKDYYASIGKEPEFVRMSRAPGIGREWYEQHKDELYKYDGKTYNVGPGKTVRAKPAKYYDKLFDIDNPEMMRHIKEVRLKAIEATISEIRSKTSLEKGDYNKAQEALALARTKILQSRNNFYSNV